MSAENRPVGRAPARLAMLRWRWHRHAGWPGALALALLGLALAVLVLLRPWVEAERHELLRAHVARLDAAARGRSAAPAATRDPRDALRDSLPGLEHRGRVIARFLGLAARAHVELARAEYAIEEQEPALSRLRVAVPVSAGYSKTRGFVAAVLDAMPNAALDSVEMEAAGDGAALDSRLHFSLYFRREPR